MAYRLLRQDCRFESYTAMLVYGVECDELKRGTFVQDVATPVCVTLSAYGTQRSDILELPCLIVSSAMRAALERAGVDNIQYIQAELQREYAEEAIHGYWVANVIGLVSCVDPLLSHTEDESIEIGGSLLAFHVDPARTYGLDLFRLAEDPRLVLISARVQAVLEAAGLRGLVFQDAGTYNGYPIDTSRPTDADPTSDR